MPDTTRIRSTAPFALTISEPMPKEFADKPGLAPSLRTAVIRPGMNDVDVDLWKAYSGADPKPEFITNGHFIESPDEGEDQPGAGFGFEPALNGASADGASDGSMIKTPGAISSVDMKPTSTAPADDSPRSEPPAPVPVVAAPAVIAPVSKPVVPAAPSK